MKKILFMIPNLDGGGAERVLVNLCNKLAEARYSVSVLTLFDGGINKKKLSTKVECECCYRHRIPGLRILLKLFSPHILAHHYIKKQADVVVAYLEGTVTRIVSGVTGDCKKIAWIHSKFGERDVAAHYVNQGECASCYNRYDRIIAVSEDVLHAFLEKFPLVTQTKTEVLHNINETDKIVQQSKEEIGNFFCKGKVNAVVVGKLVREKGVFRVLDILEKNRNIFENLHVYYVGTGSEAEEMRRLVRKYNLDEQVTLMGYQENPYKYVARADLLLCPSYTEGLSTSVTEALILGVPILTTDCGGMQELLGHSEYGYITGNNDTELYCGLKLFVEDETTRERMRLLSRQRGKEFAEERILQQTVTMLETMINN